MLSPVEGRGDSCTAAAGVTDEQYVQFVTSDAFADVPIVWLGGGLLTVAGRNEDRQPRHIDGRNAPKRVVKLRFVLCSPEFASLRLQIHHNAAPCFLSSWIAHLLVIN